jgi:multiple sugar transport system permease protein
MAQDLPLTAESIGPEQAETATAPPRELSRRSRVERVLFLLPAFLFQIVWGWYPIVVAFLLSFTNARLKRMPDFVGLENYTRLWHDPLMMRAFRVTLTYAGLSIVLTFLVPILVGILLMEMPDRTRRWMMLLWFLPLSGIASTILWRYMYNIRYGLFQNILRSVGLPEQRFLNDPKMVLFWLIFPSMLFYAPGLIYMAALQSIPTSYYEAAEIEGASFWRKIWTISLPRLRPVISMMLTFSIIGSLQIFDWPQIMTGSAGDPGGAARTVVMYIYQPLWSSLRLGDATSLAVMLFIVIMAITLIYRTLFKEDPDA